MDQRLEHLAGRPGAAAGGGGGACSAATALPDPPPELVCPICHDLMEEPQSLPCRHAACLQCITRAVDLRRECPYCRRPSTCAELSPAKEIACRIKALRAE